MTGHEDVPFEGRIVVTGSPNAGRLWSSCYSCYNCRATAGQLLQLLCSCHSSAAGPAGPLRSRGRCWNAQACDGEAVTKDITCNGRDRRDSGEAGTAVEQERKGRRHREVVASA